MSGPCGTALGPEHGGDRPRPSAVDPVWSGASSGAGCLSSDSAAGLGGHQEMAFPAPLLAGVCLVLN